MIRLKLFFGLILITSLSYGQNSSIPYSEFIVGSKRAILPIICIDKAPAGLKTSQGTGIQLGHEQLRFFVTCEHVIAFKDSTQKTIGYFNNIFVNMANQDSTTTLIRLVIDYVDEKNDFALLSIANTPDNLKVAIKLTGQYVQKSIWLNNDNYSEGDNILYIGYPMMKVVTKQNHPISRTGIIAQKIENRNYILIDGFAQHGYSGSPVFLIREKGNSIPTKWEMKLIGITSSYPSEFTDVLEQIGFRQTNQKVVLNPGFTNVVKMNVIVSAIEKTYKIKY